MSGSGRSGAVPSGTAEIPTPLTSADVVVSCALTDYFRGHGPTQSAGEDTHLATVVVAALREAGMLRDDA